MFHSHYVRQMAISVAEAAWASGPRPRPPWPSAYCLVLGGLDADRQSGSQAVTSEALVLFSATATVGESADQSEKKTKKVLFDDAGHMTRKCVDIMYVCVTFSDYMRFSTGC